MSIEKLNKELSEIPDSELIEKGRKWVSDLCASGGRKWSLRVPPDPENDPDLIFSEIMRRYEVALSKGDAVELEWYGGDGRGSIPYDKIGRFEIKCDQPLLKAVFETFSEAIEVYDSITTEKALWDLTGCPELVEAHTLKSKADECNTSKELPWLR